MARPPSSARIHTGKTTPAGSRRRLGFMRFAGFSRPDLAAGAALVLMTLAVYVPAMSAGYIWDDDQYVTDNLNLHSFIGLFDIWVHPTSSPQYYPATFSTFWVEYHLWGLNSPGYHVVNILIHAANAVLLWVALRRLGARAAWLAAALFAVHPVNVETVAWVTELKNTQSTLFYFLAFFAYWRSGLMKIDPPAHSGERIKPDGQSTLGESPTAAVELDIDATPQLVNWRFYLFALALFIWALLSKSVSGSLPAAILLIVWWKRGRLAWRDFLPLLPMFALAIALGSLTGWLEARHVGAEGADWSLSRADRLLIAGRAIWFYAGKLLIPWPVMFVYPRWTIDARQLWQWAFPITAAAVPIALWLLRKKIGRAPLAAMLFFGGSLFPALGFVNVFPMRYSFVADHFQYLASIGVLVMMAAGSLRVGEWIGDMCLHAGAKTSRAGGKANPRRAAKTTPATRPIIAPPFNAAFFAAAGVGAAVLVVFGVLTFLQTFAYASAETLWRDSIARNPDSWMSQNNLAALLAQQKRYDEAIEHYRAALKIRKEITMLTGLGYSLGQTGQLDEAISVLEDACRFDPSDVEAYCRLGEVYAMAGRADESRHAYERATSLHPTTAIDFTNLGMAYSRLDQPEKAVDCYKRAIAMDPWTLDAYVNMGVVDLRLGHDADALSSFTAARELAPEDPRPYNGRGVIYLKNGRPDLAAKEFSAAIDADPDFADACANLGEADARLGEPGEAERWFRRALELDPSNMQARAALATLYQGRSIN